MNYKPVVTGNQSNGNAGTKESDDVGKPRMKSVPGKDYILLPLWTADPPFSQISKSSPDAGFKPSSDDGKKVDEDSRNSEGIDQEKEDNVNNTNNVKDANINEGWLMKLFDAIYACQSYSTTRIHKDHPVELNMGDLNARTSTRWMSRVFFFMSLEKALYGLHQAPRAWYETLSTYLLDNGFQRGKIDKTLFIRRDKGDILLVQVYVDDIIFGSTKKSLCTEFEKMMHKKFQMSSMGELTFFLGLQVKQKEDGIFISQDKYVTEILKKFGFTDVKTTSTPMETQKLLLKDEDVCACARYQVNPKVSHLHAVKRIFRYLKGQPKLGLWYPKDSPFDLVAYTDSDYAGASLDRKSTTGGCQFLGCRLISWQCKKQTVVANSTTEAEYVAASSCCNFTSIFKYPALKQLAIKRGDEYSFVIRPCLVGVTFKSLRGSTCDQIHQTQHVLIIGTSQSHSSSKPNTMTTLKFADTHNMVAFLAKPAKSEGFEQIVDFLNAHTINTVTALVDGKKIIITESIVRRDLQLEDAEGINCLPNANIFEELTLMSAKTTAWNVFSSTMASAIIYLATNQKFNFSKYIFESMVKNLENVSGKFLMYPRFVQVFLEKQLEGMSNHKRIYVTPSRTKKIFGNMRRVGKGFSGRETPLFQTMVVQHQEEMGEDNVADEAVNEEMDDNLERAATTAISLDAYQDMGNINKIQSKSKPNEPSSLGTSSGGGPRRPETMGDTIAQTRSENVSKHSNDPLLARGNTLRSGEDRLKLKELTEFCAKLQQRVLDLENTKTAQAQEITSLKLRVKKLDKKGGSRTHKLKRLYKVGRSARMVSSDDPSLGDQEDASKQGRKLMTLIKMQILH
ncbi:uncharacterized mitochondrial protein-like protein [Tanacetum coccineum]